MSQSNYTSQSQEEQARAEFLQNQTFQTVNVNGSSSGGGKKLTFGKVNNFIQQLATGLDAANMYSSGGYPNQYQYQPPITTQPVRKSGFSPILGIVIIGAGIAFVIKQNS